MNKKYLAYIALLAGWICFCYWLYAEEVIPRFRQVRETSRPEYLEGLPFPFAFRWGSSQPVAGEGFAEWRKQFSNIDSTDEIVIVTGHYFRDEADSVSTLVTLGSERMRYGLAYLDIDPRRVMAMVLPQEINADVRSHPFESITFERIPVSEIMKTSGDTLEVCFPLKDSLILPAICTSRIVDWCRQRDENRRARPYITGTADGTGIAESIDVALDRALMIKDVLVQQGWSDEQIIITTGQRNHPLALHNRCVIVYFE